MTVAAREPLQRDATATAIVIILRKTQGSVWREAGRTELCPTLDWLRERFGHGEYELQLKLGSRIVCMVNALARQSADALPAPSVAPPRPSDDRPRFGQRRFA
jgi:hypothetical protein